MRMTEGASQPIEPGIETSSDCNGVVVIGNAKQLTRLEPGTVMHEVYDLLLYRWINEV